MGFILKVIILLMNVHCPLADHIRKYFSSLDGFFYLLSTFLLTPNVSFFSDFSMSTVILSFSYKISLAKAKLRVLRLS